MDINWPPKVTLPIKLSVRDKEIVEQMAIDEDLSMLALVMQALRFYQSVTKQVKENEGWRLEVRLVDAEGNEVSKIDRGIRR